MSSNKSHPLPTLIRVEGQPSQLKYTDVKNTVVLLSGKYYFKHDPSLVKIPTPNGKYRFFRGTSPLIIQTTKGPILKSDAVLTEDGLWFYKQDPDIIQVDMQDGKGLRWFRKAYCTKLDDRWYCITDPRIVKNYITGKYIIRENAVILDLELYGTNAYAKASDTITTKDGKITITTDSFQLMDGKTGEINYFSRHSEKARNQVASVFKDFQDKTNPQEDRVILTNAIKAELPTYYVCIIFGISSDFQYYVNKNHIAYVEEKIKEYIMPRQLSRCDEMRDAINKVFTDFDESENTAKSFKILNKGFPGKHNIYTPDNFGIPVKSRGFNLTGGLKYSFGIEFETSQGLVPKEYLDDLCCKAVGDRSIGAAEYVTSPMEGNSGIALLEAQSTEFNKHTLVDDRCGLHVHVGGISHSPSFSKEFIKNAINLGCYIEKELYSTLPPSRTPTLYHCHSIRRFGPVTNENFNTNVGAYIFGEKERWLDEDGKPITPFPFTPYKLGASRNQNIKLGTWADGRYKWLNLINTYLKTDHKTIEFRIFPGTTSFTKIYAYLMFSLAFTYVADNIPKLIKPGVTLDDLFAEAFHKYPKIIDELSSFYCKRKERFQRKKIYGDNLKHLTFLN